MGVLSSQRDVERCSLLTGPGRQRSEHRRGVGLGAGRELGCVARGIRRCRGDELAGRRGEERNRGIADRVGRDAGSAEERRAFAVAGRIAGRVDEELDAERVFGRLFSVPSTPPAAVVRTGKFCRSFAPVSASPESFGVDACCSEVDSELDVVGDGVATDEVSDGR